VYKRLGVVGAFCGPARPTTMTLFILYPRPGGAVSNQLLHRTAAPHVSGQLERVAIAVVGEPQR
jgi:hypothetical protein